MSFDFFASKSDKIALLDFIFSETDLKIFDNSSEYEQEIVEYKGTDTICNKFDLEKGGQFAVTFNLWTERFGGDILFRKIDLNPKYSKGYTFRYSSDGWGLIQLNFGGLSNNILFHSHIGHFTQKGASKWDTPDNFKGPTDKWNWTEINSTSALLKSHISKNMAVRKVNTFAVLPGADTLFDAGIKLANN